MVYVVISGYLGLMMRVGSFVASAALLFIGWVAIGSIGFRGMGDEEVAFTMVFINTCVSIAAFFMARNKLHSMIAK